VADLVKVYSHAIELQEAASRERDLITQIVGGVGRKISDKALMAIITAEQSHTDTLMQLVTPEQKKFLRVQLSGAFLDGLASLQTQAFTAAKAGSFDQKLVSDWQRTQTQYLSRVLLVAKSLGNDLQGLGSPANRLEEVEKFALPAGGLLLLVLLLVLLRSRRQGVAAAVSAPAPVEQPVYVRSSVPLPATAERHREEVVFSGRPSVSLTLVPEGEKAASGVEEGGIELGSAAPPDLRDKIENAVTSFQSAEGHLKFKKDEKG
jgi:hypothetical protein